LRLPVSNKAKFLEVQPVTNQIEIYPTAIAFSALACDINRQTLDRCSPNSRAASAALVLPEFTIRRISARWFGFIFGLRPPIRPRSRAA
jgi:hypothetical protein